MADMLVRLYDLPPLGEALERVRARGYEVRRARAYERHVALDFVAARFGQGWVSECEVAFGRQPVGCFVATCQGEAVGFACVETTARGFFGPTGVDQAHRGLGLGRALLLMALHDLRVGGHAYGIIGGVGPKAFYEKAVDAMVIPHSTPGVYRDRIKVPVVVEEGG